MHHNKLRIKKSNFRYQIGSFPSNEMKSNQQKIFEGLNIITEFFILLMSFELLVSRVWEYTLLSVSSVVPRAIKTINLFRSILAFNYFLPLTTQAVYVVYYYSLNSIGDYANTIRSIIHNILNTLKFNITTCSI